MWSFFSRDPVKGFPYEVLEKFIGLGNDQCIWSLHNGKQKSNGQSVSIFVFDISSNSETAKHTAQVSTKRLKTLKHPNILTFIDSLETEKYIYVVTEPVIPLVSHLKGVESGTSHLAISWGLHQIVKGLSFLLNSVNVIHNNVCISSMFVDASGEWKLGGTDYMYPASGEGSNIPPIKTPPALERYDPPEKNTSSGRQRKASKWSSDMWGLGCLIWEVFNGQLPRTSSLKVIGKIPKSLVRNYCELVSANPASRPSPDRFLESCSASNGFFNNHFVQTNLFLGEIQIKEPHEQSLFFTDLTKHLDEFPKIYSKHKILPQLLNAFQYGNGGPAVLPPLFKLGTLLDGSEYQAMIVPCVVKLFSSTDRATRIHLLRQLPLFVEHLQPAVVNSQVYPNMSSGFMDTNPAIREQTVKGMLLLAPKLNDNNLNNELMKHFARLQSRDDQGPIRTNTTVCLGKVTPYLSPPTRQKVITSAFARAMKDPFPAARIAGVLAMCNNLRYFTTRDCALKALPTLCAMTVDSDKQVRENAFKTMKTFVDKLETASNDPDEAARMDEAVNASATSSDEAAGWSGWMTGVSSFTSKLYTNKPKAAQARDGNPPTRPTGEAEEQKELPKSNSSGPSALVDKEVEKEGENDVLEDEDCWDSLEEFSTDSDKFSAVARQRGSYRGKLVTSGQIKAMEEQFWDDLYSKSEKSGHGVEGSNNNDLGEGEDAGWDNSGWAVEEGEVDDVASNEEDDDDDDGGWGGGWDEDTPSAKTPDIYSAVDDSSLTPASTYQWTKSQSKAEDIFFNDLLQKPTKKLGERSCQLPKSKKEATKMGFDEVKEKPKFNDTWDDDGWGNDSWGNDYASQGLSKAELLKRDREEKKRQRQKQVNERRAADKSGPKKLGSRKCD